MNPEHQPTTQEVNLTYPPKPGLIETSNFDHNPNCDRVYRELKNMKSAIAICLRETVIAVGGEIRNLKPPEDPPQKNNWTSIKISDCKEHKIP